MKITESQLRRIIREETARFRNGKIRESTDMSDLISLGAGGAAVQTGLNEIREEWYGIYNDDDPSMAELGQAVWETQVDSAIDALSEKFIDAYQEIESGLRSGDYLY